MKSSPASISPLESFGKPLFFKVANARELGLLPPATRKGDALRTWGRSLGRPVGSMQKEAMVASSRTGNVWRLASDEGPYLMGNNVAPCPLAFLTTGMVASFLNQILAFARCRGIHVRDIRLIQDNYYTMTGSALRGTMRGGALPVELSVEIDCHAEGGALADMVREAITASPATGLLGAVLDSRFTLTHNGRQIETGRVRSMGGSAEPDRANTFDGSIPAEADWTGLLLRAGLTPGTGEDTSTPGSSLAEEQHRRLHVRGICTLRADGLKTIEQHLYNPRGSIFHLLSDEATVAGGQGRAPDAATYMSAGIAFCFMTQLGRYAKIVKRDLQDYRIVQDTHFSEGSPGQRGGADPVETHVYLISDGDDSFARTALDMSEQTCFLHALCRTPLRTNIAISIRKDAR